MDFYKRGNPWSIKVFSEIALLQGCCCGLSISYHNHTTSGLFLQLTRCYVNVCFIRQTKSKSDNNLIVYNENWKYYTILVHIEISVPFCKIVSNTCTISKVNHIVLDIKPCLYSFSMSYIDSFLAGIRTKIFLHHIRTEKDVYSKQSLEQQKITEIYVYPMYFFIVKEFI